MLWVVVKSPLSNSLLDGRFSPNEIGIIPMQKLSLLVAVSVIGLGSAYSAMAQAPAAKPGAKATIPAPAVVSARGNLTSFARVTPAAEARSVQTSVGALARVSSAQAVRSATGGKMAAFAVAPAAATNAKSGVGNLANAPKAAVSASKANLSAAVNRSAQKSSAAAAKSSLNPAASKASAAVTKSKSNLGSMARVTSASKVAGVTVAGVTKRANMSALAQVAPAAAMVNNKSNFNAYAK
jgi:hypothetical protein